MSKIFIILSLFLITGCGVDPEYDDTKISVEKNPNPASNNRKIHHNW